SQKRFLLWETRSRYAQTKRPLGSAARLICFLLVFRFGRYKLPVRITRPRIASKGPQILDLNNILRVTFDKLAVLIIGRGNHLADDIDRHMRFRSLHLGTGDLRLVDADEGRTHTFAAGLALINC